ncbi:alpha-L-rhamnosidase C-terminal domain-containing protein [Nocardioides sp. S-58]|uniref:Alpha-L-rhamnosidase C-terminal domain-containing protein n=1 Tax=Nocardioides renjunii TaxID=3095075 RepID=A0ABU5KGT4_9ACTN|nr:alpha-L-rhamnosidase C-terminal domain-containing protein [Nocardioides sp. S-58]MDZ5664058.1 alpha-L-rhamnosidase C-terminal domain-containing protein [Nocardioides sp. S-58]
MSKYSLRRRGLRVASLATSALLVAGGLSLATGSNVGAGASAAADGAADSWARYVLGPDSPQVYPTAFADPRGDVTRPEALVERNGSMTLTTRPGETPASVVLDFGKEMSGVPFMDVVRTTPATPGGAAPTLQVVTGEARSFLRRAAATAVSANTPAGATVIPVASTAGLEVDSEVVIGTGEAAQRRTIVAFLPNAVPGQGAGTITLDQPLTAPVTGPVPASGGNPSVPGTPVTSAALGPASDENPGQSLVGGNDYLTPTGPGRVEAGAHPGFRFVMLTLQTPGTLVLRDLGVDFQAYRATAKDYRGWFESSDDELNRLWYAGAYTLQTNLKLPGLRGLPDGRIYDGAKRDGSIWTGDLIIQGPTAISTLGDVGEQYVKWSLDELIREQRADGHLPGSPDFNKGRLNTNPASGPNAPYEVGQGAPIYYSVNYSGYGARSIIDYYRYSGDEAYARQTLEDVREAVAYNQRFLDTEKNLIAPRNPANPEDPNYTRGDRDYFQSYMPGYVTKFSIDYYILLREMAWYEREIGSAARAADYDATADRIKAAVTSTLWNQRLGVFGQSDLKPDLVAGDVNGLALQYGFVPKGQEGRVLEALKVNWNPHGAIMGEGLVDPTGHTIEPFGIGMETGGRLAVDDTAGAFDLMRRTWGTMIDPANPLYTGTFWEFKNTEGGVNRTTASLAHGWAASPTVQLTESVLGVRPVGPGYSTWTVKPHPGDLAFSRGVVPTETGSIAASWKQDKQAGTFSMQLDTPAGTSGTVAVPVEADSVVRVDGQPVWVAGTSVARNATLADGYVTFNAGSGALAVTVAPQGAGPVTPPVGKADSEVKVKVKPGRPSTTERAKVRIRVRSTGDPRGKVTVRVDGRLVKKVRLDGSGRASTRLPRLKAGTHRVAVAYPGDEAIEPSRGRATVKVVRRKR